MNVTLINLPAKRFRYTSLGILPPLGAAYIAAVLLEKGHCVSIIDIPALNLSIDKFKVLIRNSRSQVYGISSTLFGFQDVIKFSAVIREENPKAVIVLGGLCTVLPPQDILKKITTIDIVIQGEGEIPLSKLCDVLSNNGNLKEIDGISFRNNGDFFYSPPKNNLDLNKIPFPAYNLLDMKRYYLHPPFGICSPVISMETSRGCPFNCQFCCLFKSYRTRDVENIIEEILRLKKDYGTNEIYFVDHTFTLSAERIYALCHKIINSGIRICWSCKTRVDLVSEEMLKIMKAAGCYIISYGIESGSEKILHNLNKGISIRDIEKAIYLTKKHGIRSIAYMIVGSPGETKTTIKESLKLIKRVKPDYILYNALAPDPGSTLYSKAINRNILSKDFFKDNVFSPQDNEWPLYSTSVFTKSDIEYWVRKGTREFYFNIFYVIRCLKRIRTIKEFKIILKGISILLLDIFFRRSKDLIN